MASEIRVDKINSLSGVGTVTLSPTGVDIAGITTAATLRATTGIVTSLTSGSLTSLGAVSGTTGTFSGAISGTTGTFSGAVSGTTGTFSSHVSLGDGDELRIGDSSDLKLYHTAGTANYIQASGGHANIHISNLHQLKNQANDEFLLTATNGGAVELYHNNSKKIETTSSGATVTGAQTITGGGSDNLKIDMTGANDPYINFREGSTNKCFFQWDSGNDDLRIYNYDSVADLRIGDGGIKFGGDTAAANALDDYEEGSHTTTVTISGNTSFSYSSRVLSYTKIGRVVHIVGRINLTGASSGSSFAFSLPFANGDGGTNFQFETSNNMQLIRGDTDRSFRIREGESVASLENSSGSPVNTGTGDPHINVNITYFTS